MAKMGASRSLSFIKNNGKGILWAIIIGIVIYVVIKGKNGLRDMAKGISDLFGNAGSIITNTTGIIATGQDSQQTKANQTLIAHAAYADSNYWKSQKPGSLIDSTAVSNIVEMMHDSINFLGLCDFGALMGAAKSCANQAQMSQCFDRFKTRYNQDFLAYLDGPLWIGPSAFQFNQFNDYCKGLPLN